MLEVSYRSILKVALPLMASSFIQAVVLITDSAFLSRYSTLDFDASGNAGILYITLYIVMIGLNDGSQILMARRIGEQRTDRLAKIFGSTLMSNMIFACLLFLIIQWIVPAALHSYSASEVLAEKQSIFITTRGYAMFFATITLAINAYFMATGKTTVVLLGALITALSNIFLDYSLIFGHFGMNEMGLQGAALASTLAEGIGMIFLIVILNYSPIQRTHQILKHINVELQPLKEVIKIGTPIMFQGMIALSVWTIFFTWIEQMGVYELTVSQNIRSIYFLTFVPIWGFGATTKTYISQYIGHKEFSQLRVIQRKIQLLTVVFLLVFVHGALLYPETFVKLINPEIEYVAESGAILRMIFGSILLYSFVSVYFQTINGSGNTQITFYIELASVIVYITLSYLLIKVYETSIFWIWTVEYAYFGMLGLLSILYLRNANWTSKKL